MRHDQRSRHPDRDANRLEVRTYQSAGWACKLLPEQRHRRPWCVRHGRGKLQLIRGCHRQKADRGDHSSCALAPGGKLTRPPSKQKVPQCAGPGETDLPLNEKNDPEMSYRRGYQDGALEMLRAVERFLDPTTRQVARGWIEQDINGWRLKAMLGQPPTWRLTELNALKPK